MRSRDKLLSALSDPFKRVKIDLGTGTSAPRPLTFALTGTSLTGPARALCRCSQPDAAPDTACSDLPTLTIQNFSRDPAQACAMSRVVRVYNLALWRWMLMALLYWPLHIIAHVFARIVATVVSSLALTKHVRRCSAAGWAGLDARHTSARSRLRPRPPCGGPDGRARHTRG